MCSSSHHRETSTSTQATTHPHLCTSIGSGYYTLKREEPLHPDDKAYNKTVNQVRYKIERVIANIKTWRVLHTGYTRPLDTFPETITAILGIIFTYTP